MTAPAIPKRSGCPVSMSLDVLGDKWSLLLIRDMMVRGYRTFGQFQRSGEGIATNILADRLRRLEGAALLTVEPSADDARSLHYRLTEKGIDLAPVLLELLIWGARHQPTGAPCGVIEHMATHRAEVLHETRRRWAERDPTPILPPFGSVPAETVVHGAHAATAVKSTTRAPKQRRQGR